MNLFYTQNIQGNMAHFDEEEARHLFVLRKKSGDKLWFTDGNGTRYEGNITLIEKRQCSVIIEKRIENHNALPYQLHVAIAPTKNMDRLEWFLEKATEIGLTELTLLACQNSERDRVRIDRLTGITLSAMKQSLQSYLPKINPLTPCLDFIAKHQNQQKLIAYCNDESLPHIASVISAKTNTTIMIGPEGDFSEKEIAYAKNTDYQGISLGINRLRTETAGLFVTSIAAAKNTI